MNRRSLFLMSGGAATRSISRPDPNYTIRFAVAGVRGLGGSHIRMYTGIPVVDIAALCDIDGSVPEKRLRDAESTGRKRPAGRGDYRKLLENRAIDVFSLATPNHHHAFQTIWAPEAGKDVDVGGPARTICMYEVQQPTAASRRYRQRIVAHETNSWLSPALNEAFRKMCEGLVGGLYTAQGLCFKWRNTIGRTPPEPVPPGVHYDLCLGPTPKGEFTRSRFHYNWHWFRDCGNGDPGNQGIHDVDAARWGLGVTHPSKISSMGDHFKFDDEQETPNTLTALFEFDAAGKKKLMVFEVRRWIPNHEGEIGVGSKKEGANTIGTIFYRLKGSLVVEGYTKYYTFLGREREPGPGCQEGGNNRADFMSAVRSRKASDLSATPEDGAVSCALVYLANISYRLGRTLSFDAEKLQCVGDEKANRMFTHHYRKPFVAPRVA